MQHVGETLCRVINGFAYSFSQLIKPLFQAIRRSRRIDSRKAKTFERSDPSNSRGANPGIQTRDVPTHTVPDERYRIGAIVIEDRLQVRHIVLKPVGCVIAFATPESAPVWRDEVIAAGKGIDQKLERIGAVLESV